MTNLYYPISYRQIVGFDARRSEHHYYLIQNIPGRRNLSGEPCSWGSLGTTNNCQAIALGEYDNIDDARQAIHNDLAEYAPEESAEHQGLSLGDDVAQYFWPVCDRGDCGCGDANTVEAYSHHNQELAYMTAEEWLSDYNREDGATLADLLADADTDDVVLVDGVAGLRRRIEAICNYDAERGVWHTTNGGHEYTYEPDEVDSASHACEQFVVDSAWDRPTDSTVWITVRAWRYDWEGDGLDARITRVGEEVHAIQVDPEEPPCTADGAEGEHNWKSPHRIVGGLSENPGVQGHGGGVLVTEVCMHCGCARITDTWARDPVTGQQGLTSISYEPGRYADDLKAE